jgi:hypothetical protein
VGHVIVARVLFLVEIALSEINMDQFDSTLSVYGKSGLRTVADWNERGRSIEPGATPRADATFRGVQLALFSRDQTKIRHSTHVPPHPASTGEDDQVQIG